MTCFKYWFRKKNEKECELTKPQIVHHIYPDEKPIFHYSPRQKLYKANSKMAKVNIPDDE
jgi:hypothetical protein